MSFTATFAAVFLLMQASQANEEAFVFEGDDPFAQDVKIYRYHGALEDADPQQTIVCRDVMELGSKLPSRICRKLDKWQEIYDDNQSDLEQKRRSKRSGANNSDTTSASSAAS